ncbi:hypothetical protein HYX07_02870 [Candidatus Woesearchaeota archaeon]|nr:hypothetical protein [Candidatus Woesearchaeota archaeon]
MVMLADAHGTKRDTNHWELTPKGWVRKGVIGKAKLLTDPKDYPEYPAVVGVVTALPEEWRSRTKKDLPDMPSEIFATVVYGDGPYASFVAGNHYGRITRGLRGRIGSLVHGTPIFYDAHFISQMIRPSPTLPELSDIVQNPGDWKVVRDNVLRSLRDSADMGDPYNGPWPPEFENPVTQFLYGFQKRFGFTSPRDFKRAELLTQYLQKLGIGPEPKRFDDELVNKAKLLTHEGEYPQVVGIVAAKKDFWERGLATNYPAEVYAVLITREEGHNLARIVGKSPFIAVDSRDFTPGIRGRIGQSVHDSPIHFDSRYMESRLMGVEAPEEIMDVVNRPQIWVGIPHEALYPIREWANREAPNVSMDPRPPLHKGGLDRMVYAIQRATGHTSPRHFEFAGHLVGAINNVLYGSPRSGK